MAGCCRRARMLRSAAKAAFVGIGGNELQRGLLAATGNIPKYQVHAAHAATCKQALDLPGTDTRTGFKFAGGLFRTRFSGVLAGGELEPQAVGVRFKQAQHARHELRLIAQAPFHPDRMFRLGLLHRLVKHRLDDPQLFSRGLLHGLPPASTC